ncbi:MAG: hypothetical protein BWZ00_01597 [Bacteroidetes bacterium ADurb.BinA174]|nr:MAG: hypothetical protein BWZ00_01597 [Bacteroidetes bacterium ADurb.BinA174]
METKKGKLVKIIEKVKQDGSGSYYLVTCEDVSVTPHKPLPEHLCFDKKVMGYKVGEVFEFTSNEKDGKHFMNFPKDSAKTGGGSGSRSDLQAKINGLLQSHTMPMSYAKDIIVAEINAGLVKDHGEIRALLVDLYMVLHNAVALDPAIQSAMNIKPIGVMKEKESNTLNTERINFEKDFREFQTGLITFGWEIPKETYANMLERLSGTKDGNGRVTGGVKNIADMSDEQVKLASERFKKFQTAECPGSHVGCKFYANTAEAPHYCAWATRCFYIKNKLGKGE